MDPGPEGPTLIACAVSWHTNSNPPSDPLFIFDLIFIDYNLESGLLAYTTNLLTSAVGTEIDIVYFYS